MPAPLTARPLLRLLPALMAGLVVLLPATEARASRTAREVYHPWYQWFHASPYPGSLHGVTPQGEISLAGALQQNLPVAYTPVWGNAVVGGYSGSNTGRLEVGKFSGLDVNGGVVGGVGFGSPGRGVYLSWMATGADLGETLSLQVQLAPGEGRTPALALGVGDVLNMREWRGGEPHTARHFYLVATAPADWPGLPPRSYWTAGIGTGRFGDGLGRAAEERGRGTVGLFGGLSVPWGEHLRGVAEWSGLSTNLGLAYGVNGAASTQPWELTGYLGWTDLAKPVVGINYSRSRF